MLPPNSNTDEKLRNYLVTYLAVVPIHGWSRDCVVTDIVYGHKVEIMDDLVEIVRYYPGDVRQTEHLCRRERLITIFAEQPVAG